MLGLKLIHVSKRGHWCVRRVYCSVTRGRVSFDFLNIGCDVNDGRKCYGIQIHCCWENFTGCFITIWGALYMCFRWAYSGVTKSQPLRSPRPDRETYYHQGPRINMKFVRYCCRAGQNSDRYDQFDDFDHLAALNLMTFHKTFRQMPVKFHNDRASRNIYRALKISRSLTIRNNAQNCHKKAALTTPLFISEQCLDWHQTAAQYRITTSILKPHLMVHTGIWAISAYHALCYWHGVSVVRYRCLDCIACC